MLMRCGQKNNSGFGVAIYLPIFTLINPSNKTGQTKLANFAFWVLTR
jgi:hypothetical protein